MSEEHFIPYVIIGKNSFIQYPHLVIMCISLNSASVCVLKWNPMNHVSKLITTFRGADLIEKIELAVKTCVKNYEHLTLLQSFIPYAIRMT